MNIQNFTILGAGTLGSRVGLQAAISGFEVMIFDIKQEALDNSLKTIKKIIHQLQKTGELKTGQEETILARINFTLDPVEAVKDADFINESVTEDLRLKKKVWQQFGSLAPAKTIFTTNTSYMLASMFAEDSGRPEKFCAFHFHDVFYSKVVDIMPHPGTDPEVVHLLDELGRKLNQVPVLVKKENPGYIFNSMLLALIGSAGKLLTGEIGDVETIDKSWMVNFHMPMGPFGILDSVGLDTAWHITKSKSDPASVAFAALLKSYLDQGKLGEKSGEGFYSYPNPRYRHPDFVK